MTRPSAASTPSDASSGGPRFPEATGNALFAAILIDDRIDPDLLLPDRIEVDHAQAELIDCFRLSRQLWRDGIDPVGLKAMATTLFRTRTLQADDRVRFKNIRAKFKHFRYMHAAIDAAHRYPPLLNRITVTMGQTQDAFRLGRGPTVMLRAALLRLMLMAGSMRRIHRESDRLAPATPASVRARAARDLAVLDALLASPTVDGHRFHAARKVIGRQVAFWNTLLVLQPSEDRLRMARWLSAINGGMGALHDQLVEQRAEDHSSYGRSFALPDEIRRRMVALNDRVRSALAG